MSNNEPRSAYGFPERWLWNDGRTVLIPTEAGAPLPSGTNSEVLRAALHAATIDVEPIGSFAPSFHTSADRDTPTVLAVYTDDAGRWWVINGLYQPYLEGAGSVWAAPTSEEPGGQSGPLVHRHPNGEIRAAVMTIKIWAASDLNEIHRLITGGQPAEAVTA